MPRKSGEVFLKSISQLSLSLEASWAMSSHPQTTAPTLSLEPSLTLPTKSLERIAVSHGTFMLSEMFLFLSDLYSEDRNQTPQLWEEIFDTEKTIF